MTIKSFDGSHNSCVICLFATYVVQKNVFTFTLNRSRYYQFVVIKLDEKALRLWSISMHEFRAQIRGSFFTATNIIRFVHNLSSDIAPQGNKRVGQLPVSAAHEDRRSKQEHN